MMNRKLKRVLVVVTGWAFLVVGFIGLFLPILQGILFILIGLIILSTEYVWAHRLLNRFRARFPRLGRTADEATVKASGWLRRISGQQPAD